MVSLRKLVKNTCLWNFLNSQPGKYIKFFILLILDMINLIVDWIFYAKVTLIQPGLVYGPPSYSFKIAVLVFCCIAILGFFIETIQNGDELLAKKRLPFLKPSMTNFILILLEDFPLLVLNLMLTVCQDGTPTVISVVKSSVCIAVVIIRLIFMIIYYWFIEGKKSRFETIMDILSSIGLVVIASLSIAIQLLNNFPTNSNGLIENTNPATFNSFDFAANKYLKNVGIFTRFPVDNSFIGLNSNQTNTNYIWLADVSEVITNNYLDILVQSDYSLLNSNYTLCITKTNNLKTYNIKNCYLVNNLTYFSTINQTLNNFFPTNSYHMAISKEPAQTYVYLIGYIDYNLNFITTSFVNNTLISTTCTESNALNMIYAKFLDNVNNTYLRNNSAAGFSFYNLNTDLTTVDKLWRTGVVGCPMSGDFGPKLNKQIRLVC